MRRFVLQPSSFVRRRFINQRARFIHHPGALLLLLLLSCAIAPAQSRKVKPSKPPQSKQSSAASQLAESREAYLKATKEYKASLEQLLVLYEASVRRAEEHLSKAKELYAQGIVSKRELETDELSVASAKDKVNEVRQQMVTADSRIAETLVEAEAETQMARALPATRGALVQTTSYIRYNGLGAWSLADAWKVQQFFQEKFRRPLPISAFGQSSLHDRWRLDHHNAMDVGVNPDGVEGQALMSFLRANGIPFAAFRVAIPGSATGPHIHIGSPSHRY